MTEFYAGLDVSDLTTAVCVINGRGKTIFEESVATTPPAIATALKPYTRMLGGVGHESGSKGPWLHKELMKRNLPMVYIDARMAHGPLSAQRNKTDKNDARGIAQILRSGWYTRAHVKGDDAFRTRLMLTFRKSLKRSALGLEMTLRMSVKVFGARVVKKRGELTLVQAPRKADAVVARLAKTMIEARAGLLVEIKALDVVLTRMAKSDPVCRRLMTIPGVGPLTSLAFKAGVDDPARFTSSRQVGAHFGLTPRRRQSGQMDVSGKISKMGDDGVRSALYEAAFVLITLSRSRCALRGWALKLHRDKGLRPACVALARKLAVIMHRMWVTGRDFDPDFIGDTNATAGSRK